MAVSGKVTASTVAASVTAVVGGIIGPHVFPHGTPADIKGLSLGVITAGVTFVSGFLAKHGIDPAAVEADAVSLGKDLGIPFSAISESGEVPAVAPVAPVAVTPSVPVA